MTNDDIYTIVARVLNRTRYMQFTCSADSMTAMLTCDIADALRAVDPNFDHNQFHVETQRKDVPWRTLSELAQEVVAGQ